MRAGKLLLTSRAESAGTILARQQLLQSFRDPEYRHAFVNERLRASVALQIRALRHSRGMTQKDLGEAIGMAQTWVSMLENPDYGKVTVATLLRLAEAFDIDVEIKFRPFSRALETLPEQGPEYFSAPSFAEEFELGKLAPE
jgi:transcriptional regulator with XRE-family HTH domain